MKQQPNERLKKPLVHVCSTVTMRVNLDEIRVSLASIMGQDGIGLLWC